MQTGNYPSLRLSWTIWGLGALLYLIGFYQRVAPGVMTVELMTDFRLNATSMGNLSAFYFYSYVAMQIPTGLLADHWGPRRLLALGATVAGFGTLLFALAPDAWWANTGRLMIGGSVAVAFVGMLKLASHWLPPKQYAMASGMALFCGIIGAVFAGVPLGLFVDSYGWRPVMIASAIATFGVAVGIWMVVRDDPKEKGYASYAAYHRDDDTRVRDGAFAGIRAVFRYRNTWLLYLVPGAVVGSVLTFAGLWGVPFLTTHYAMDKTQAAALCSALLIAWAVGGPIFGWLSDHLGHRKPLYALGCLVILAGWGMLILIPGPSGRRSGHASDSGGILLRQHDYRLRLCERVSAGAPDGHGLRRGQHGGDDGPDAAAAGSGMDARPVLGWTNVSRRADLQSGGLSERLWPDVGMACACDGPDPVHPRNPLQAYGMKHLSPGASIACSG